MELYLMKRPLTLASAMVLSSLTALSFAEDTTETSEQTAKSMEFVVAAGLTFGGDDIFDVEFTDGSSESIEAGGLFNAKAGIQYYFSDAPASLLGTVGYHFDSVSAQNGDATFSRFPIDLTAFYHFEEHRIGLGGSLHTGTELDIDFDPSVLGFGATNGTIDFDDALGLVLEYGYRFKNSGATIAVRAVQIDYKASTANAAKISGDHIGLYAYLNF